MNAELIFRRGTPPDAEYTFKHALVQDAAYSTLLRSRRQQLHARIASILESQFPDVVETQPELLGRHFGEGGFEEKAIAYFTIAGERAVKRGANAEVIRHFRRALELLQGRPETAERSKAELKVLEKLGPALAAAHGFGAPEVERTYLRARDLCEQLGEPVELFRALWGLWVNTVGRERFEAARPIADELFAVARQLNDPALLLEAHHAMCPTTLWVGNPQATRIHGEQGMRLYEQGATSVTRVPFWRSRSRRVLPHAFRHGTLVPWIPRERAGAQPHRSGDGEGTLARRDYPQRTSVRWHR